MWFVDERLSLIVFIFCFLLMFVVEFLCVCACMFVSVCACTLTCPYLCILKQEDMSTPQGSILHHFGSMPPKKNPSPPHPPDPPGLNTINAPSAATAATVGAGKTPHCAVGEGMLAQGKSESWESVKKNIVRIVGTFFDWLKQLDVAKQDNATALSFAVDSWKQLTPAQMISKRLIFVILTCMLFMVFFWCKKTSSFSLCLFY